MVPIHFGYSTLFQYKLYLRLHILLSRYVKSLILRISRISHQVPWIVVKLYKTCAHYERNGRLTVENAFDMWVTAQLSLVIFVLNERLKGKLMSVKMAVSVGVIE